jgi:hypothetical protein
MLGQTVRSGGYFEGSTGYGPDAATMKRDQIEKYQGEDGFDLVLDGPVRVYDVRPLRHAAQTYDERPSPGLPGTWTPWQAAATGVLLLLGLLLRGRLLDPRRFRARDVWRPAVALPAAMLVGAGGVLAGFSPVGGFIAASVILYALIRLSKQPAPLGRPDRGSWVWGVPIALVVVATVAIAVWSAWHGLLDHAVLPAPAAGGDV